MIFAPLWKIATITYGSVRAMAFQKYNLKTEEFTNYNSLNGIGVYEFTPHSGLLLPNGEICFSGNNGFVTFSPQELQLNSFVPPLVFTKLVVNNQVD